MRPTFWVAIAALVVTVVLGIILAWAGADATKTVSPDEAAEVGVGYRHRLYTPCGILSTHFDRRLWRADPPLDDGSGNPPTGWGNPYQLGTIRLLSRDEAEFRTDDGRRAHFVPLLAGAKDPAEGCA